MKLNIRAAHTEAKHYDCMYSLVPPPMTVDGRSGKNFYLLIETITKGLATWSGEKVYRKSKGDGIWQIWSDSREYRLSLKKKGGRLYVVSFNFLTPLIAFLYSVESMLDTEAKVDEAADDERGITNRVELPLEIDQWIDQSGYASGRSLTVGKSPSKTPPPMPSGVYGYISKK